jgi:hypothetical protein
LSIKQSTGANAARRSGSRAYLGERRNHNQHNSQRYEPKEMFHDIPQKNVMQRLVENEQAHRRMEVPPPSIKKKNRPANGYSVLGDFCIWQRLMCSFLATKFQ